jgi:hypothetical protein
MARPCNNLTYRTFRNSRYSPKYRYEKGAFFMDIPQLIQRYIWLFFGVLSLGMAGHAAVTGKLRGRFGQVSYRAQNPKQFWGSLTIYCLFGTGFVLFFLYKIHASSN